MCRCVDRATKKAYAAKRLSIDEDVFSPYLLDNEMHNLPQINDRKIPRVVKFITMLPDSNGDPVFVLE